MWREQYLRIAIDDLALLSDRSYISYQRRHCGSGALRIGPLTCMAFVWVDRLHGNVCANG